ncbi:MAG: gamma-glutamyltransferase family protein [Anaerolineae bacterium]
MREFAWEFPYPSQRMPVLARNVVATSQPLAAQAGLRMLLRGGNAVDAALAAAIALTVVEPTSNGIGGDAFAIVWEGDRLHGLNASGRSPMALTRQRFRGMQTMPALGWDTVTVPGAVSAWVALWRRFGRLPFDDLFEPAITYAADGFLVSPVTAKAWAQAAETYRDFPEFGRAFLPGGRAPQAGERFAFPEQARTLQRIAKTEGEAFYRGEIADKIVAHAQATGGLFTLEDLAAHEPEWVETISADYRGLSVHELPPNGQGVAALMALGILEHWGLGEYPADFAESLHVQIEAMKLALADARRYVADPRAMRVGVRQLLDRGYLAERAKLIDIKRAQDFGPGMPPGGGTVYLAAADGEGMMVSYIQSNFKGFGSGIVVPGTGISLQNRGYGFTLERGHPNEVAGGKRPYHTTIPGFVMYEGAPLMAFGVMGGAMQPQGHVQVLVRLADYGQNPQAIADAPRWQVVQGVEVALEDRFEPAVAEALQARRHQVRVMPAGVYFGGAQLVYRLKDGYLAASEPRKDGQAVGY